MEKKYTDPNNKKYFSRGYEAFQNGDYMTSAMYLVALLEARVDRLVQFPPNTKYKDKYSNKGFVDVKKEQFEGRHFVRKLSPLSFCSQSE